MMTCQDYNSSVADPGIERRSDAQTRGFSTTYHSQIPNNFTASCQKKWQDYEKKFPAHVHRRHVQVSVKHSL